MLHTVTDSEGTATQKREKSDIQKKNPDSSRKGKLFYWLNLESQDVCNTFGDSFHWKLEKLVPGEIILLFKKLSSSKQLIPWGF